jgi:glycosyltransferase involved in cell wall biosynthesis
VRKADLLILGQENKLLHNYPLLLARKLGLVRRVAFFGHGRNFQGDRSSLSERFKRLYTSAPDWWFAYTEQSRKAVEAAGFPADRITVFQNSIDTSALAAQLESVTPEDRQSFRRRMSDGEAEIGLFLGGLYREKRLEFLIQAVDLIKKQRPNFLLLVAGDGPECDVVVAAAATRPWLRWLGPTFGRDKAILLKSADLFLMPGLVGLAVLDCLAAGLPMVTTAFPWHSPEIAYLADGTGVIEQDWESAEAYARAIVRLLGDSATRSKIAAAAKSAASAYTMEEMVARFATGICQCLAATDPIAAWTTSNREVAR